MAKQNKAFINDLKNKLGEHDALPQKTAKRIVQLYGVSSDPTLKDLRRSKAFVKAIELTKKAGKPQPFYILSSLLNSFSYSAMTNKKDTVANFLFSAFSDQNFEDFFNIIKENETHLNLLKRTRQAQESKTPYESALPAFETLMKDGHFSDKVAAIFAQINAQHVSIIKTRSFMAKITRSNWKPLSFDAQLKERDVSLKVLSRVILDHLDAPKMGNENSPLKIKAPDNAHKVKKTSNTINSSHPLIHLIDALKDQASDIKITSVITGESPENKKKGHYYIASTNRPGLSFAVAEGHLAYVIRREANFTNNSVLLNELQDDDLVYQTCDFDPKRPMTWVSSILYYANTPVETLGVQNKKKTSWANKKDNLIEAFTMAVENNRATPDRNAQIKSEDKDIDGKTWNSAYLALKRGNIKGLEHVKNLNELFFDRCVNDHGFVKHVDPEWWDDTRYKRREKQTAFLARVAIPQEPL